MLTPYQIVEAGKGSEHSHQAALFQFISIEMLQYWPALRYALAIPNGGDFGLDKNRAKVTGARMKAEGMKPGVPDLFWPWGPKTGQDGVWIELKRPEKAPVPLKRGNGVLGGHHEDGRVRGDRSDEQMRWHLWLRGQGWPVVVAYGWMDAAWALALHATGRLGMTSENDALFAYGSISAPNMKEFNS